MRTMIANHPVLREDYLQILTAAKDASKLSQLQIGKIAGLSQQGVSTVFTGRSEALQAIKEVCLAVGIPLKALIREDLKT